MEIVGSTVCVFAGVAVPSLFTWTESTTSCVALLSAWLSMLDVGARHIWLLVLVEAVVSLELL